MSSKNLLLIVLFFVSITILSYLEMSNNQSLIQHAKKFDQNHLKIAHELISANKGNSMLKKALDFHNSYYRDVENDVKGLSKFVAQYLQKNDPQKIRQEAVNRMKNDAELMNEVKAYVSGLEEVDYNDSYVRFAHNKTPLILNEAIKNLQNDHYFNSIVLGEIPHDFKWDELTMMGGVEGLDEKGASAISTFAASLFYMLPKDDLHDLVKNKTAIIYNESIAVVLKNNQELLQKLRQNYYLFSLENDAVAKVYEAYEFGGDNDLNALYNPKNLPLDCSSGVATLLGIKKNKFSTYHLASYYNEFFKENSVYWKSHDWPIREEMLKNLKPVKFSNYNQLKAGDIIAWRSLENEKSLKNPKSYVGKGGHIGVVIGQKDGEVYYLSWMRNLEEENKSGFGIDVINIKESEKKIYDYKIAVFSFEEK